MKKIFYLLFFLAVSNQLCAQIDNNFWFVAPEVSINHGDRPIYMRIATMSDTANIVLRMPASPSFTPITQKINPNTSFSIDLTPWIDSIEDKPSDQVLDRGLQLTSDKNITAYYEVANASNPAVSSMKGKNALGTEFYISGQTDYPNQANDGSETFDIVATEDNTHINITPRIAIIGHAAGITFQVVLNKGQTYCARTLDITAAASLDSLVKREETVKPPYSAKDFIRKVYNENQPPPEVDGTVKQMPATGPDRESKDRHHTEMKVKPQGKTNEKYVSRTDPEATVVHNARGGLRLAYKAHVAVSGKRGLVVTAAIATTGITGEEHLLNDVLQSHTRHTGMPVKQAVADTRYGMLANYTTLEQAGIAAFIPPHDRTNGVNGFWGRDHFRYVPEQDVYLCPAGQSMKCFGISLGKKRVLYRCDPGICQVCQSHNQCTPPGNPRTVTRFFDQRLIEEAKERIESPVGKELIRQRKTRIEGIFALGKELHGLRRTRLMGRWKVQIQLWMTATVINLKRAIKALTARLERVDPKRTNNSSSPIAITVVLSFIAANWPLRQQSQA